MIPETIAYPSPDAARHFTRSIKETGFAVLTDHPVPAELIERTYRDWHRFFSSPNKGMYLFDPKTFSGYYPYQSENARDNPAKDLKEFFHVYAWSALPDGMGSATRELFGRLSSLAAELLTWIESNTPAEIGSRFSMPLSRMIENSQRTVFRILHYPPVIATAEEGAVRASDHEDINLLTLLPAATASGLQVLDHSGSWHDVSCDPSSIVVNSGDMLQMASQGYYRSTTHRVVNPTGADAYRSRYSMPLFLHPRPEVRLSPSYRAFDYLNERLVEIGLPPYDDMS